LPVVGFDILWQSGAHNVSDHHLTPMFIAAFWSPLPVWSIFTTLCQSRQSRWASHFRFFLGGVGVVLRLKRDVIVSGSCERC
jgi:hypothetical protein